MGNAISARWGTASRLVSSARDKASRGDIQGAIRDYDKIIALNSEGDTQARNFLYYAHEHRGYCKLMLGRPEAAIEDFDACERMGACADVYYARGRARYDLDNAEGAIEDYDQAMASNGVTVDMYFDRGLAKARVKDVAGAMEDYVNGIAWDTHNDQRYPNEKKHEKKRPLADYYRPLYESIDLSHMMTRVATLRETLQTILEELPEFAPFYRCLGYVLEIEAGRDEAGLRAALEQYDLAIKFEPEERLFYHDRAMLRAKLGDADGARDDLREAKSKNEYLSEGRGYLNMERSPFKREYGACKAPANKDALMDEARILLQLFHDEPPPGFKCSDPGDFHSRLEAEVPADATVEQAAQLLWSSTEKSSDGREFCSYFNATTRFSVDTICEDVKKAPHAAKIARAINATLLMERNPKHGQPKPQPLFPTGGTEDGKTFRGTGFPADYKRFKECQDWYNEMKGQGGIRIPNYFATSTELGTAEAFMGYALDDHGRPPVLFEVEFAPIQQDARGRLTGGCVHANLIENDHGLDEAEYLFVPYSAFEVVDATWQTERATPAHPHVIRLRAYPDNREVSEDCPIAIWT